MSDNWFGRWAVRSLVVMGNVCGGRRLASRRQRHVRLAAACETLEDRRLLASDWHNALVPLNVDDSADEAVSPLDAVLVVNELTARTVSDPVTGRLVELTGGATADAYFDVNDDGFVSPIDALLVINSLDASRYLEDFTDWETGGIGGVRDPLSALGILATEALSLDTDSGEFIVNTETKHAQRDIDIAGSANGSYVAVWISDWQDDSGWGVYGQRFDLDGNRLGEEFLVNTATKWSQRAPAVTMAEDGSFVVVWQSKHQDGSGWGIYGQRFGSDGVAVGDEFLVNETTRGTQSQADVTMTTDGGFVVVWNGRGRGDQSGVFARRFDAAGVTAGGEFLVNQTTAGHQLRPAIAATGNGGVAIAWDRSGAEDQAGVYLRQFGLDNEPLSDETLVNTIVPGIQRHAAVSVADDGSLVVAWQHRPEPGGRWGVRAQRFNADGTRAGDSIIVNQTTRSIQKRPDIAQLSDGGFVVGWFGYGMDDRRGIYVRRFDSTGTAVEDEGLVNETTAGVQRRPSLAEVPGGVVIAWEGRGAGDRQIGVFARSLRQSENAVGPSIVAIDDRTTAQDTAVTLDVEASDADTPASELIYSAVATGNATATFDAAIPNRLTVTPPTGFAGEITVTVTVSDGEFSAAETFNLTVTAPAQPPTITAIDDRTTEQDMAVTLDVEATDADTAAAELTYSATATNGATAQFSATVPNRLTVTPASGFIGTVSVTVTVSDGDLQATESFAITVSAAPQGPTITPIADQEMDEDTSLTIDIVASDPDTPTGSLTYSASATNGATVDFDAAVPNRLTVTPASGFVGTLTVTVTVSDGERTASDTFDVTVNAVTFAPVITPIADQTTQQNVPVTLSVIATDQDTDPSGLTFSATADNGATVGFDASVPSRLTVTPASGFVGVISVTVTVTDADSNSATDTFAVTVTETPASTAPMLGTIGEQSTDIDTPLTIDIPATDSDTPFESLVFTATSSRGGTVEVDSTVNNRLTITPPAGFAGAFDVTVTVSDGTQTDTATFLVAAVDTANQTVELSMAIGELDATPGIVVGEQFDVMVSFHDTASDQAVFSGFADLLFDEAFLRVDEINYGANYPAGQSGTIDNENGIVNEAGAADGLEAPPSDLVVILRVTAIAAGTAIISSEAADAGFSETVIFGASTNQRDNVFYGAIVVVIEQSST